MACLTYFNNTMEKFTGNSRIMNCEVLCILGPITLARKTSQTILEPEEWASDFVAFWICEWTFAPDIAPVFGGHLCATEPGMNILSSSLITVYSTPFCYPQNTAIGFTIFLIFLDLMIARSITVKVRLGMSLASTWPVPTSFLSHLIICVGSTKLLWEMSQTIVITNIRSWWWMYIIHHIKWSM